MTDRRKNFEMSLEKSAHRVRRLVCETNKFGGPGQFLDPASNANGRPFALLAVRIFCLWECTKSRENRCRGKRDGV